MDKFWEVIEACPLQMEYPPSVNNGYVPIIRRTYNSIKHVIGYAPSKRNFSVIHVQIDDYIHFFEKISKEYCCTYLCISDIPFRSMSKGFKKFRGMNENSRREYVLNSLSSNACISREVGTKKRTPFIMKFDTLKYV